MNTCWPCSSRWLHDLHPRAMATCKSLHQVKNWKKNPHMWLTGYWGWVWKPERKELERNTKIMHRKVEEYMTLWGKPEQMHWAQHNLRLQNDKNSCTVICTTQVIKSTQHRNCLVTYSQYRCCTLVQHTMCSTKHDMVWKHSSLPLTCASPLIATGTEKVFCI